MARPRVFLSSTFYDLRHVRNDLERFVRELGYEPVLHERGHVAYGHTEELEQYCYREIHNCDIVVSIVGSRFGSQSTKDDLSVSQLELKTAIDLGKQIYLFIDRSVFHEYNTYLRNRDNATVKYVAVDDPKIFKFVEYVKGLPQNNIIHSFESVEEICSFLREQWAGLFQRMLNQESKRSESEIINDMKTSARTLKELVDFLTKERQNQSEAIRHIIFANHPIFASLAKATNTPYRVYFTTRNEMKVWLRARTWKEEITQDEDNEYWEFVGESHISTLRISSTVFDADGNLKPFTPTEWDDSLISRETKVKRAVRQSTPSSDDLDDDIPF